MYSNIIVGLLREIYIIREEKQGEIYIYYLILLGEWLSINQSYILQQ
jgi:hypothetical protein